MKKPFLFFGVLFMSVLCFAQRPTLKIENPYKKSNKTTKPVLTGSDEDQIKFVVQELFDAMHAADSSRARVLFTPTARLISTSFDQYNNPVVNEVPIPNFIANIGSAQKGLLKETIFNTEVRIEDNLATVWTDYNFYVGDKFNHCGVDAFQLVKGQDGWKIIHVSDTRKKDECSEEPVSAIDQLLNDWHAAAARSDANSYFGAFADDGIFLGTDATEKWTVSEFKQMTANSFKNNSAWDFKPQDRQVDFNETGDFAWFEETLDTWMGVCRGSGVLSQEGDQWKIKQYNLAILVPNDKIQSYLQLLKN